MFVIVKSGEITGTIEPGRSLVIDSIDYGPDWRNLVDLSSLGILEVVESQEPDQRFYWTNSSIQLFNGIPHRVYTATAKDLDSLKQQYIAANKQNCNQQLQETDWMLIRKLERNIAVPPVMEQLRAQIVTNCNQLEASILAVTTVEELIDLVSPGSQKYVPSSVQPDLPVPQLQPIPAVQQVLVEQQTPVEQVLAALPEQLSVDTLTTSQIATLV